METENSYEFDTVLSNYLSNYVELDRAKLIVSIFNVLNNINNIVFVQEEMDLAKLESILIDMITEDMINVDDVNMDIQLTITSHIQEYLGRYNIIIVDELRYSYLLDILTAIYYIYMLDIDIIKYHLTNIDIDDDPYETLIFLLSEYTTMSTIDLHECIADVGTAFIENLVAFFKERVNSYVIEQNAAIENELKEIIKIDESVTSTYYYKDIMENGYTEYTLEEVKELLYNNLSKYGDNLELVPSEIIITLYMVNKSKDEILSIFDKELDRTWSKPTDLNLPMDTIRERINSILTVKRS